MEYLLQNTNITISIINSILQIFSYINAKEMRIDIKKPICQLFFYQLNTFWITLIFITYLSL